MSKWKVHATVGNMPFAVIIYADNEDDVMHIFGNLYPHAYYSYKESMPDDPEGDSDE